MGAYARFVDIQFRLGRVTEAQVRLLCTRRLITEAERDSILGGGDGA